jgi:AraC-like DNA-binding protein
MLDRGEILTRYQGPLVGVHHVRVAGDDHSTHAHDELQLLVAFAGRSMHATWSGSTGSRRRFRMENEHIAVVEAGQDHRFDWSFIDMVSVFASPALITRALDEAFRFTPSIGDVQCINDAMIVQHAMAVAREVQSPYPESLAIEAAIVTMFTRVGERRAGRSARHVRLSERGLQELIEYIEGHLHEPLSITHLAHAAGLPPFAFARAFRERCGVPPYRWVLRRRLARAKSALVGSQTIAEIALDTGFAHQSHFTEAFRAENGITPSRYRQLAAPSSGIR